MIVVAMMVLAMIPMTASATTLDRHSSIVIVDPEAPTSVPADASTDIEYTVYLKSSPTVDVNGGDVNARIFVSSSRGFSTDTLSTKTGTAATLLGATDFVNASGSVVGGSTNIVANTVYMLEPAAGSNKVEFKINSALAGDAKIVIAGKINDGAAAFGDDNATAKNIYQVANGTSVNAAEICLLYNQSVSFTDEGLTVADISVSGTPKKKSGGAAATALLAGEWDSTPTGKSAALAEVANSTDIKANGLDYYEFEFFVTKTGGVPVGSQNIDLSTNRTGITFSKTTLTTDPAGKAKVKVYANRDQEYTIQAKAGNESTYIKATFHPGNASKAEVVAGADAKVARNGEWDIDLRMMDSSGRQVNPVAGLSALAVGADKMATSGETGLGTTVEFELLTKPSGTNLAEKDLLLYNSNDLLRVKIPANKLNKDGDYSLRVRIGSGYVDVPFSVQQQGSIVQLTLAYKESTLGVNTVSGAPSIKRLDAEGVAEKVSNQSGDLSFSSSNTYLFTVDDGSGVAADKGKVTATNFETADHHFGTATITVVDAKTNLVASYQMTKVYRPSGVNLEVKNAAAGEDATVTVTMVDVNGSPVQLGSTYVDAGYDLTTYIVSKPDGAMVGESRSNSFVKDLKEKGKTDVLVSSNMEGEVVVSVVVRVQALPGGPFTYYSGQATLNFGEAVPEDEGEAPEYGAASVTMFIGANSFVEDGAGGTMDVAPFIEDGRTFVPVRFIAEALGVEDDGMSWGPEGQDVEWVILSRPDKTITINIGEYSLEVTEGEEVTTITMDCAAMIKDGRTFLPFRFIAEAFGAEVEYGPEDGPVEWVTFLQ